MLLSLLGEQRGYNGLSPFILPSTLFALTLSTHHPPLSSASAALGRSINHFAHPTLDVLFAPPPRCAILKILKPGVEECGERCREAD